MRTRCCIWVKLYRESWKVFMTHTLDRFIVDFFMRNHETIRQIFTRNRKTMVLACKVYTTSYNFSNSMVETTVSKFHLISLSTICLGIQLMAHTNSKNRDFPLDTTNHLQRFRYIIWISRTIGQHHTIWREC